MQILTAEKRARLGAKKRQVAIDLCGHCGLPFLIKRSIATLIHRQNYSVRSAITGSFFAALFAGISPEIEVKTTLNSTSKTASKIGRAAI